MSLFESRKKIVTTKILDILSEEQLNLKYQKTGDFFRFQIDMNLIAFHSIYADKMV